MQASLFIALGLLAGCLSGLIGIGGGVILVPALIFFFGMSQHLAQGTTLALMVPPIGFLAAWSYYKQGYVNLRIAALVCVGFFFGGFCGAKLAEILPNATLEKIFAIGLGALALKILISPASSAEQAQQSHESASSRSISFKTGLLLVIAGAVVGISSGLLGIGGGVLLVPALSVLFGLSQHEAQGTTLTLMVPPIGLLAAMQYYQNGDVNVTAGAFICAGFFFGALGGARLAHGMSAHILTKVFGVSVLLIAAKMFFAG